MTQRIRPLVVPMNVPPAALHLAAQARPTSATYAFPSRGFLSFFASLIFLVPLNMYGQNPSAIAESRIACAQGLGQQAVNRARAMGIQMGLADVCVGALKWSANNGRVLDMYMSNSGQEAARLLVNRLTDKAQLSTGPFVSSGSPAEMWNKGELSPSLAFDAGFTRAYLEKSNAPAGSMSAAELKRQTEACLSLVSSLAACANVGRIQGALAYQISNAFSDSAASTPKSDSAGPDRTQTAAAIDRKFRNWAQSWMLDRYNPGSVQVTDIACSDQCKASGKFSFSRLGVIHTIPFVALLPSEGDGKYSLGRLCYKDDTTGMLDCTN